MDRDGPRRHSGSIAVELDGLGFWLWAAVFFVAAACILRFLWIETEAERRKTECRRTCQALDVRFVAASDYGCVCSEPLVDMPFMLGSLSGPD